jgi:ABC-type lipoprotein release transport system permease subunit
MFEFKFAFSKISHSPATFVFLSVLIILFITVSVIGNSLFSSAREEFFKQIKDFFPGSLIIKKKATQADLSVFSESPLGPLQILPAFSEIMKYARAHPQVTEIMPFNYAQLKLKVGDESLINTGVLCLPADFYDFLLENLEFEQGSLPSSSQRGLAMSQEFKEHLLAEFHAAFNLGDMLTLKSPSLPYGFTEYKIPLTGFFTLKDARSEFDSISFLMLADEISFKILLNLPMKRRQDYGIALSERQNNNKNEGTLFVQPDLKNFPLSDQIIFNLLGDVKQKYLDNTSGTEPWQGVLLRTLATSDQGAAGIISDFTAYFKTNQIPAYIKDWPGKNLPQGMEAGYLFFILFLLVAGLFIIILSNILYRPKPNEDKLLELYKEKKASFSTPGLYFSQSLLQSITCGVVGMGFAYLILKFLLKGEITAQPGSIFYGLFKTRHVFVELKAWAILFACGFLFLYSLCSWIYPAYCCLRKRKQLNN